MLGIPVGLRGGYRIRQIDAVLLRLESGNYGTCVICSEPIGIGRLLATLPVSERLGYAELNKPG